MFPFSKTKIPNCSKTTDSPAGHDLMRGVSFQTRLLIFVLLAFAFGVASCTAQSKTGQWVHTAWTDQQGAPSVITAISQGSDGFLYLASPVGLTRFDGVSFEQIWIPEAKYGSDSGAFFLLRRHNGELWVTAPAGIVVLHDGRPERLIPAGMLQGAFVRAMAEDRHGVVWVASSSGIFRFSSDRWEELGQKDGLPTVRFESVVASRDGAVWVATGNSVYSLSAGEKTFQDRQVHGTSIKQLIQDSTGRVWVVDLGRSVYPVYSPADPMRDSEIQVGSGASLFDSDGALWVASRGDGLRRVENAGAPFGKVHQFGREASMFTKADGLTDNYLFAIFQDDDGDIWTGGSHGLDCFRKSRLVTQQSVITSVSKPTIAPGSFGDIWLAFAGFFGHASLKPGGMDIHDVVLVNERGKPKQPVMIRSVFGASAPPMCDAEAFGAVCSDGERARHVSYPSNVNPTTSQGKAWIDGRHTLWIATQDYGILYHNAEIWKSIPTEGGRPTTPVTAVASSHDGAEWVAFGDRVIKVQQYRVQDVPFSRQLGIGPINYIDDHPDHVWFGGAYGLAYHGDQGVVRIETEDAAMLNGITGVQEARDGSLWIATLHGLLHLRSDEVVRALHEPQYRLAYEVLGVEEGIPGSSLSSEQLTSQGILWLIGSSGIGYMNVDQPFAPTRPPTVRVRELEANGALISVAEKLSLGPGISNLKIRYAGANLANPENLIYRYRLSGVDKDWQNAGNAREAMYTNLPPGRYVFHVMAKNGGGAWSSDQEFISVYLIPAWYQRTISKIFAVAALLCALLAFFRWRLKLAEGSILKSCDARLAERLRISADLHDTLLQTVQGSKLIAEDALAQQPDASMRPSMERILFRLAQAVEEGRETLKALRSTSGVRDELAKTLSKIATETCGLKPMTVSIDVGGITRAMHPVVHDEISLICREAIRNACAHSNGARLSIILLYEKDFSLTVSDDGQGISNTILENGRTGHFGLPSMRERAERIGGRLKIISQPGLGTNVIIEVPGSVAYVNVRKTSGSQEA
jgi:signal transduction histidine kinase/ligand-binding sensor domain-containing protein